MPEGGLREAAMLPPAWAQLEEKPLDESDLSTVGGPEDDLLFQLDADEEVQAARELGFFSPSAKESQVEPLPTAQAPEAVPATHDSLHNARAARKVDRSPWPTHSPMVAIASPKAVRATAITPSPYRYSETRKEVTACALRFYGDTVGFLPTVAT